MKPPMKPDDEELEEELKRLKKEALDNPETPEKVICPRPLLIPEEEEDHAKG